MTATKIEFKPYRGHLEPVGDVRKAEIHLHPNHLEYIYDYDYTQHKGEQTVRTCAITIPKHQLSVSLTTWYHEDDSEKITNPQVELYVSGCYQELIYVEKMSKAEKIYTQIKEWLIG